MLWTYNRMDALPVVIPCIILVIVQGIFMGCGYCSLTRRLTKLEILLYTSVPPPFTASVTLRSPELPPRPSSEFVTISLRDGQAADTGQTDQYVGGYRF